MTRTGPKIDRAYRREGFISLPWIAFGLAILLTIAVARELSAGSNPAHIDLDAVAAQVIVDQLKKPFRETGAVACIGIVTTAEKMATVAGVRDLPEAAMEHIREAELAFPAHRQFVNASACAPYKRQGVIHLATKGPAVYVYFAVGDDGQVFFGGHSGEGFHTAWRYRLQDGTGQVAILPDRGEAIIVVAH